MDIGQIRKILELRSEKFSWSDVMLLISIEHLTQLPEEYNGGILIDPQEDITSQIEDALSPFQDGEAERPFSV